LFLSRKGRDFFIKSTNLSNLSPKINKKEEEEEEEEEEEDGRR